MKTLSIKKAMIIGAATAAVLLAATAAQSATFTMNAGTTIKDCEAKTNGGGVFVAKNAVFNMNGGEISGNAAKTDGGGVFINKDGVGNMKGGKIINNRAGSNGRNVCLSNSPF